MTLDERKPENDEFGFWNDAAIKTPPAPVDVAPGEGLAVPQPGKVTTQQTGPDTILLTTAKGYTKTVRPWGIRNVLYSFLAFLGVQILISAIVIFYALSQIDVASFAGNPTGGTDALLKQVTTYASLPGFILIAQFILYGSWLAFIHFATMRRGQRSYEKDFGLRFRWYDPAIGAVAAWLLIAAEFGVNYLLQKVLFPHADYSGANNGAFLENLKGGWFIIVGIGIGGIVGPFFEELYFRGFIMRGIQRYLTRYAPKIGLIAINTVAVVVSSTIFGLSHFQGSFATLGLVLVPIITGSLGVILALVSLKTKRLGINIFIHMFFNTTTLLLSVFAPNLGQ